MRQNISGQGTTLRDNLIKDLLAGTIVAASNVALAAGFAVVIFQGDLKEGFPAGMWSILVSMIIVGVVVGILTTLRPVVAGGPDTAVVAVLSILASSIAADMLRSGAQTDNVVTHVLFTITLAAALYGLILWTLGAMGWAKALRFVPFPLIGGFLAATGALLLKGSPEIVLGSNISLESLSLIPNTNIGSQLWFMVAYFVFVTIAHHTIKSPFIMPLSFFVAVALCHLAIQLELVDGTNWFVSASNGLQAWRPISAITSGQIQWAVIVNATPEIITCILVGLFSLVVRVSTIEAMRRDSADLDRELCSYGVANLLGAPAGAMPSSVLFSSSKLIQVAGYRTPVCYFVTAVLLFAIVAFGADLSPLLPKPVLGGLLLFLGYTMCIEAARIAFRQSTLNVILAVVIFVTCLQFGFITGAIFGVLCACLIFAIDSSRTGVIRHQFTRADISAGTEWPVNVEDHICKFGHSIHIYELSGFIFFGSSEDLFRNIRSNVVTQSDPPVAFIVLDQSKVSGYDGAALNTMIKLQSFADKMGIQLLFCGTDKKITASLEKSGVLSGAEDHLNFSSRLAAVYWCERQLLEKIPAPPDAADSISFKCWMSNEIGVEITDDILSNCFLKLRFEPGEKIYHQGSDADTIDFISSGSVIMKLKVGPDEQTIRRSMRRTVVGEMGFFRDAKRSVSIFADEPLVIYSLTRDKFKELESHSPTVHARILAFIIRVLADRVDMANREISVLR